MREQERKRADAILKHALDLSGTERTAFLNAECVDDALLRAAVDRLLAAAESNEPLLASGDSASGPLLSALESDGLPPSTLAAGDEIGAYRLVRILGRGGMATVYLAERADGQFEHQVALKVLDGTRYSGDAAARFTQERQILATLDHPHIARMIDGGTTGTGQPYVVMEYVDGTPVDVFCDENRLAVDERIELFGLVAGAVHYAHGRLIVHRDIKPSNILVGRDGKPKLLDFGIAKLLDAGMPNIAPETRDAIHPMTPEYASPEQLQGQPLTVASDVYQLGLLLHCLLSGQPPYTLERANLAEVARVVCTVEPARPSEAARLGEDDSPTREDSPASRAAARRTTPERLRKKLAGDLDNIVLNALRKLPAERYPSVLHLREDLRRHARGHPVTARPPTTAYRVAKFVGRNRLGVAAAALFAIAVTAGIASTAWQAKATAREAERAEAALEFLVGLFGNADPDVSLGEPITASELLDRGKAQLDAGAAGTQETRAEMLGLIGGLYVDIGNYEAALPLLREAGSLLTSGSGTRPRAENLDQLAMLFYERGEYEKAAASAEKAIALRRQDRQTTPGEIATSLGNLASTLSRLGAFERADALYQEAIRLDEESGNDELRAAHLSDYGSALYRAGAFDEARTAGEASLALHRELYGPVHTLIATSLLNLGTVYMDQGDYDRAEALLRECLVMRRQLLGEEHPHVATALSNLGHLLSDVGRPDAAEAMHRQALAIRRVTLGDSHPDVANTMNHLGVNMYFNARYSEAADIFEDVVEIWRDIYGPRHDNVYMALNNLGAASREAGDYDRAEAVLRETLQLRQEALGESSPQIAQSMNNLAILLEKRREDEEAEALFHAAIAMWRETLGSDHPDVAYGLMSLGVLLLNNERYVEAEMPLRENHAIRERVLDADAPLLASSRLYLGECLLRLGRHDEAEPLLAESLPVLVDHYGDEADVTLRAKRVVASLQR